VRCRRRKWGGVCCWSTEWLGRKQTTTIFYSWAGRPLRKQSNKTTCHCGYDL